MVCRGCGVEKPSEDFYAGRRKCKRCVIDRVVSHPNRLMEKIS